MADPPLVLPSDQDKLTLPSDQPEAEPVSGGRATWEGFKTGASFGTSDQLSGLAGITPVEPGSEAFMTPEQHQQRIEQADKDYHKAEANARAVREAAQAQHPALFGTGEFGGALATLAVPVGGELASGAG